MAVNKNPISLREGKVFLNGAQVMDSVSCKIVFTPEVWQGRPQLGTRENSSRWLGYKISVTMSQRRSTKLYKETIDRFIQSGITPEFTIQGISNDVNSDYYKEHGSNTVTAVGCVPTGDISLLELDTDGDIATDTVTFNAYTVL